LQKPIQQPNPPYPGEQSHSAQQSQSDHPTWSKRTAQRLAGAHPSIQEIGARRQASLLAWLSLLFILTLTLSILSTVIGDMRGLFSPSNLLLIFITAAVIVVYVFSRSPYPWVGSAVFVITVTVATYLDILYNPTAQLASALYTFTTLTLILGSVLLPIWGEAILIVANVVMLLLLPALDSKYAYQDIGGLVGVMITMGGLLLVVMAFRNNVERDRLADLKAVNRQLEDARATLEENVAARTRALAASFQVSQRLSTILDQAELLKAVVDEVCQAFDYYHVHIYLYDEQREYLRMVGGTGEAGQVMLNQQHKILRGNGLVGRAAEANQVVLVPDTRADPGWLPNPLLTETRSEVAIPIAVADQVLGVLDVQQNVVGGLSQQDADLLLSIASQVAIAVQNTHLYSLAQREAEREALAGAIAQKIQTATSVDAVLQIALRELSSALGADRSMIQIAMKDSRREKVARG
jgi:GAF domain-containing protein